MRELIMCLIFILPAALSFSAWGARCKIVELQANAPVELHKKLAQILSQVFWLNTGIVLLSVLIFLAASNKWWPQ